MFRINYKAVFVNDGGTLDCTATFDVEVLAPAPSPQNGATSSPSGMPLAAPIGGAIGAITVVIGLGALLLLWQRRRTDALHKQLAASAVPCEVALAVSCVVWPLESGDYRQKQKCEGRRKVKEIMGELH